MLSLCGREGDDGLFWATPDDQAIEENRAACEGAAIAAWGVVGIAVRLKIEQGRRIPAKGNSQVFCAIEI